MHIVGPASFSSTCSERCCFTLRVQAKTVTLFNVIYAEMTNYISCIYTSAKVVSKATSAQKKNDLNLGITAGRRNL